MTAEPPRGEPAAKPAQDPESRVKDAQALVRRHALMAAGVGVLPLPLLDFLGISLLQIKMLRELAARYDVAFSEQVAKKIIAALVAGLGSAGLGFALAGSLAKFVPLIGANLGALSVPVVAGAFTLATGRVFIAHFESGGTVLNFDPQAIRAHFRDEFERARQGVTQLQAEPDPRRAPPPL